MTITIRGVICFGDSIFAGTGASDRELGCAKLIKSSLLVPVMLRGRNWNTSQDGLDRLKSDVLEQKDFTHVLILFGNNDCWLIKPGQPRISIAQFKENVRLVVSEISSHMQVPILCTLQPIDFKRFSSKFPELMIFGKNLGLDPAQLQREYSNSIFDLATELKISCVDLRSKLEAAAAEDVVALDGIHPNDQGHKIIASSIVSFLKTLDPNIAQ